MQVVPSWAARHLAVLGVVVRVEAGGGGQAGDGGLGPAGRPAADLGHKGALRQLASLLLPLPSSACEWAAVITMSSDR